ncbi:MAG: hypothetical protein CMH83_19175 [Nocardioides sp.]|nr:hypothetical protein [Nocardioides sp.]
MSGADPQPGDLLGPFRVGDQLGVGGMGVVYTALDTQLNRQVALKIISSRLGQDEEFRARFTREARAQASLDSPHVVSVYSFGEADGRLYIASQLIPDGDLGQMLHRHGVPPARIALHLISQVAEGLGDAHAAGLVHRDIKPGNVLLRNRENTLHAYLADFGIARQANPEQQLTRVGGIVGTPSYMAPELHTGGEAGPQSDVYSLGCLLWACLSGSSPYAGENDFAVIRGHVEGPVPQLEQTGPLASEINRVLRRALAKSPSDRYPTANAMRDDLKRVVRMPDDPTPPRPVGASGPAARPTPSGSSAPPPASNPGRGQEPWRFAPPRTPTPSGPGTPPRGAPVPPELREPSNPSHPSSPRTPTPSGTPGTPSSPGTPSGARPPAYAPPPQSGYGRPPSGPSKPGMSASDKRLLTIMGAALGGIVLLTLLLVLLISAAG